jgi:hypothetical protein
MGWSPTTAIDFEWGVPPKREPTVVEHPARTAGRRNNGW